MAAPKFLWSSPGVSAASNADLTLSLPTGDPTGKLLLAVVASWTVSGTPRTVPAGWRALVGWPGLPLQVFWKIGVLADSGGTVTFPAWSPEVIAEQNSGIVLEYDNAIAVDTWAGIGQASGIQARAPQVRPTHAPTAVLAVFAGKASKKGHWLLLDYYERALYDPTGANKLWLGVSEQIMNSPGLAYPMEAGTDDYNMAWRSLSLALRGDVAPNAPNLIAPVGGTAVDRTQTVRLSWSPFSDPDPDDTQSTADIRYARTADVLGGTPTWTTLHPATGTDSFVDVASGTFTAATSYTWQVRVYDNRSNVSAWSAQTTFIAQAPGPAPTITSPAAGGTITAPTATVTWTHTTSQLMYQLRRVADNAGAANTSIVYWDSGQNSDTSGAIGSYTVPFDVNSRTEHLQVRIFDGFLWTAWADVLVHVAYTPPATPVINTVTADPTTGSITVAYTNPSGGAVAAVSVDVYRRVTGDTSAGIRIGTGLALSATFTDWLPASGVDYQYQVGAVAADGAVASSTWSSGPLGLSDLLFPETSQDG